MSLLLLILSIASQQAEPPKLVLPEGLETYTIKGDATDYNGDMGPGIKVLVTGSVKVKGAIVAETILKDVLVVAVEVSLTKDQKIKAWTTTLAVKSEDAKKLIEAEKLGKIEIVLPSQK